MSKVSILKCKSYDTVLIYKTLSEGFSLLGGLDNIITENSNVLIKPNLLSAKDPKEAVTTHPEFVRAIIRVLKERNCKISVGDSPSGYGSKLVDRVYDVTGMKDVCAQENVELVKFDKAREIDGIPIAELVLDADLVISVPKLKTHGITTLTGAVKNMYGGIPGLAKVEFHKQFPDPAEFSKFVAKTFSLMKPGLAIVDGICAMDGEGPSGGSIKNLGLIIMGQDAVSVDAVLADITGMDIKKMYSINRADGVSDISKIQVIGEKLKGVKASGFKLPSSSIIDKIPKPILKVIIKLVSFKPRIDAKNCTRCSICVKSCPVETIIQKSPEDFPYISYDKCITCLCCYESCTYDAVKINKSLLVKFFSLLYRIKKFIARK